LQEKKLGTDVIEMHDEHGKITIESLRSFYGVCINTQ